MHKKFLGLVSGFLVALLMTAPAYADGHTVSVKTVYNLSSNKISSVKHVFTTKNRHQGSLPEVVRIAIAGPDVSDVTAVAGKTKLGLRLDTNKEFAEIEIPSSQRDSKGDWSFTFSYKLPLIKDMGATKAAQITALQTNLDVTSQTTEVRADVGLGFASVRGPAPSKTSLGAAQQILTFSNRSGQVEHSPVLVFGDKTYATVKFTTELQNSSFWWQDIILTLPPDTNQQQVLLDSIEPKPTNLRLDRDGNIMAIYRLGPKQSQQVTADMFITLESFNYKLDETAGINSIDPQLLERYSRQTDNWQPIGLELEADGSKAADLVKEVFGQVVNRAREESDNQTLQLASRSGALKYTDWLVGELRHNGVPARAVIGLISSDGHRLTNTPRSHAWAEVYIPGTGWTTLDPWFAIRNGGFGGTDPLHLAIGLWGIEEDRPPIILEGLALSYETEARAETEPVLPVISATKYVWLPFVSTLSVQADWPAGAISDGNAMRVGENVYDVGSVSPLQSSRIRLARFGRAAFSSETASVGQVNENGFTSLADTQSSNNYTPMLVIGGGFALWLAWIIWRRRRGSKRFKTTRSKESLTLQTDQAGEDVELENLFDSNHEPVSVPPPAQDRQQRVARPAGTDNYRTNPARPPMRRGVTMRPNNVRSHDVNRTQLIQ